jgi:hypothetical protein
MQNGDFESHWLAVKAGSSKDAVQTLDKFNHVFRMQVEISGRG